MAALDLSVRTDTRTRFWEVAALCERLTSSPRRECEAALQAAFTRWRATRGDIFPLLRLLLPDKDRDRPRYYMQANKIAKAYVKAVGLPETTEAAARLIHFKSPNSNTKENLGNFAGTLEAFLQNRTRVEDGKGRATIAQVNEKLDELAAIGSREDVSAGEANSRRLNIFLWARDNLSPRENKWFARVVLQNLGLGVGFRTIYNAWHPQAVAQDDVGMPLVEVCRQLYDNVTSVETTDIQLFRPFNPMPCSTGKSFAAVLRAMKSPTFWIETKYDGHRVCIHYQRDDKIEMWSRRRVNITRYYGSAATDPSEFLYYVRKSINPKVTNCILDGELLAYDSNTGAMHSNMGVPRTQNVNMLSCDIAAGQFLPVFIAFDCVFLDNKSLSKCPLVQRWEALHHILQPTQETSECVRIVDRFEARSESDILKVFEEQVSLGNEGVIVKDPSETYQSGNKRSQLYFKIKPDHFPDLAETIDCLVVGVGYGDTSRGGLFTRFYLALRDTNPDGTLVFKTISKLGSGYTNAELGLINAQYENRLVKFDVSKPPAWLVHPAHRGGQKNCPDMVFPNYETAPVAEVLAAAVIASEEMGCGMTFRFPRMKTFCRDDKNYLSCDTVAKVRRFYEETPGGSLVNALNEGLRRRAGEEGGGEDSVSGGAGRENSGTSGRRGYRGYTQRKRHSGDSRESAGRLIAARQRATVIESQLRPSLRDIPQLTSLFSKQGTIFVMNEGAKARRDDTFRLIIAHGGRPATKITDSNLWIAVHDLDDGYVERLAQDMVNKPTIVTSKYIEDCVSSRRILPLMPEYVRLISRRQKFETSLAIDAYGDSYTKHTTAAQVRRMFEVMNARQTVLDPATGSRTHVLVQMRREEAFKAQGFLRPPDPRFKVPLIRENTLLEPALRLAVEINERYDIAGYETGTRRSLFQRCIFYVDVFEPVALVASPDEADMADRSRKKVPTGRLHILRPQLAFYGGQVSDYLTENVTHILVDEERDPSRFSDITRVTGGMTLTRPYVVSHKWATESLAMGRLAEERLFFMPNVLRRGRAAQDAVN